MRKFYILLSLLFCTTVASSQQNLPNEILYKITEKAYLGNQAPTFKQESMHQGSNLEKFFIKQDEIRHTDFSKYTSRANKSLDTLIVGASPGDSLYITGSFFNDGPIFVLNDGILVFENADALINGDVYVWGTTARLEILNSTMHFPQYYIYQRTMAAVGSGLIEIHNSTLDYSGMSHNLVITDSAKVLWRDVEKIGFTTCGLSSMAEIDINGTSEAGEFVMTNQCKLHFSNAETILLWHNIPDTASLNITFPDGDSIATFVFSDTTTGNVNLLYSYNLDTCQNIMWGLMPEPGSQTIIHDSEIRTIGVWFRNQTNFQVSGLVNNSQYTSFIAPLSGHDIQLYNTFVQTWSLYIFEDATGDVNNCIVGEIGLLNNGSVEMMNSIVDGSGGYMFVESTSLAICGYSYLNSDFHTNDEAFGIMAYSAQNWGRCIAKDRSIMFIIQSNLTQEPEYYNDAIVWYLKLEGSSTVYSDSIIPIIGSAWIDKASGFNSLDFGWYELYYRINENDPWIQIGDRSYTETHSDSLELWDTHGLSSGVYLLRLVMCDNTLDSNTVEAVRQVVMMPSVASINEQQTISCFVYPNPAHDNFFISTAKSVRIDDIHLLSITGKKITCDFSLEGEDVYKIIVGSLPKGMYLLQITSNDGTFANQKILIQ